MGVLLHDLVGFIGLKARSSRDEPSHGDVLFDPLEIIGLPVEGGVGEDPGRLLEGGGGDEGVGVESGLGDSQQAR